VDDEDDGEDDDEDEDVEEVWVEEIEVDGGGMVEVMGVVMVMG